MSTKERTGGQENLQGVYYQLVRSLFHSTQILQVTVFDDHSTKYMVVLEPAKGGDLQLEAIGAVTIEQTKKRKQRSWSLTEVVNKVLPDLYQAFVDSANRPPIQEARFVTDGRQGQWKAAEEFFHSLKGRDYDPKSLDDSSILKVNAPGLEREGNRLTERGIFHSISQILVGQREPSQREERAVWNLLGCFEFRPIDGAELRGEIERRLRSRVAREEDIETVVYALIGELLDKAKDGSTINPKELLASHRLADIGLDDRLALVERARQVLRATLNRLGYLPAQDVRKQRWQSLPDDQALGDEKPRVLVGESGQGKSWALYAYAQSLSEQDRLVILVDAGDDRTSTSRRAAKLFCHEIWGLDREVPIERLWQRLKDIESEGTDVWLDLLVDGVTRLEQAQELAAYDWAAKGIRICYCWTTSGGSDRQELSGRCRVQEVPDFFNRELHDYLKRRLGEGSIRVPYSETSILHRPFLARIFCDIASKDDRPPENEYRLLAQYWETFLHQRPLAAEALSELAATSPEGRVYPWSLRTLRDAGVTERDLRYLAGRGVLRRSQDGRYYEVWHDRILSWALAEGLAALVRDGQMEIDDLAVRLRALRDPNEPSHRWDRRWLGDAVMDVLWLLLEPEARLQEPLGEVLVSIQSSLRPEGLSVLGARVVPALFALVRNQASRSTPWVSALKETDAPDVGFRASELLASDVDLDVRLAAAEILGTHPHVTALDGLWSLRCELEWQEPKDLHAIHGVVEKALMACAVDADDWVRKTLRTADPSEQPISALVYLLPQMKCGPVLWEELKTVIFQRIDTQDERCIAVCLESFLDPSRNDWLEERVQRDDDVGPAARRALFLLDPNRTPDPIENDGIWLPVGRGWWLGPHLNANPEATEEYIRRQVCRSQDRWDTAWSFLSGFENRINPATLDLLLDAFADILSVEATVESQQEEGGDPLWAPLVFLAKINSLRLVERFEARQGSQLEYDLATWLRARGPQYGRSSRPRVDRAMAILKRIGGERLTDVINSWLEEAGDLWSLRDAIELAVLRPDNRTAQLLHEIASRERVEGSEFPLTQREAISCLATIGRTDLAVDGLMKWALRLSWQQVDIFREHPLKENDLNVALALLESSSEPDPNAVFTVGLARRQADVTRLHNILQETQLGSELARSTLLALYLIEDRSVATERAYLEHLNEDETEYACVLGLLQIRTPRALAVLKSRLSDLRKNRLSSSDIAILIAINLLSFEETKLDVAEYLWENLDGWRILFVVRGQLTPFSDLQREDVDEWLFSIAMGTNGMNWGAQVNAIEAVAGRDPDRAFDAAKRLLRAVGQDRERAPRLLLDIDSEGALALFKSHLKSENQIVVLMAIGESLLSTDNLDALSEWLQDESPAIREGACIAAEILPWSRFLEKRLRCLVYDREWDVRNAANRALNELVQARETDRLIDAFLSEADQARRWRFLELILEGAHPGLWRDPPWLSRIWEQLSLAMRNRASERLEARRQELRRELQKRRRFD